MFQSIHLKDFQKHRDIEIQFDPAITTISGESDQGKSSIIRALYWVCFNQPVGDWMVRHNQKGVRGKLVTTDGVVVRRRGKNNLYFGNGKKYVSFGPGKVPDGVAEILKVGEVNFQHQGDPPFWFSDTPGKVSQELNAVVDLAIIDTSLAKAQSQVREATATAKVCLSRLSAAKLTRLSLAWVPEMVEKLEHLTKLKATIDECRQISSQIASGVEKARNLVEVARNAADAKVGLLELMSVAQAALETREEADAITSISERIVTYEKKARYIPPDWIKFDRMLAKIQKLTEEANHIDDITECIGQEEACLRNAKRSFTRISETLREESGGLCPVCGSPT